MIGFFHCGGLCNGVTRHRYGLRPLPARSSAYAGEALKAFWDGACVNLKG